MSDNFYSSIEPISEFIEPFKRKSKIHYGFHGYFTTQPFNVVFDYINHFSKKGDLIIDPFCGSGVTGVEGLKLERKVFVSDLNPFAIFLTKAKCSNVDLIKLNTHFEKIVSSVEKRCEEIEALTDDEAINLEIPYWYPKNVKLPSNADREYLHEIFTNKQLYQLSFIKSKIDMIKDSPEKDILLILFCGTLSRANIAYSLPDDGRSIYSGDFTIFHTGRYRVPANITKLPVLPIFKRRFKDLYEAKKETNKYISGDSLKNFNAQICSATNLKKYLKDSSVDYIYTDPPYGGHITYLDLSTVYNSWLGFEVSEDSRKQEAIEGGELKQTKETYFNLLGESFSEMARVLKPNRWCSLIFHHKEPSLWTNIVETAREVGFEFKNTVVQHTKLPSWHKVDVPQSVMSAQMIINFIRKDSPSVFRINKDLTLDQLVLNVAEREIIKRHGANLEDIVNALVPELFMHNIVHNKSQTKTDYIRKLLITEFDYNPVSYIYQIRHDKNKSIGSYIPMQDKIKMYLISYMRNNVKSNFDDIISVVLPQLTNGRTPKTQEILNELEKIAKFDGKYWVFKQGTFQKSILFEEPKVDPIVKKDIPDTTEHNQMIYRLAAIGSKYGLSPKIGNQEQKDPALKLVNKVANLSYDVPKKLLSYINQIDCLWVEPKSRTPLFAFEVEHSTDIDTAFERFISLLKADSNIGQQRRLILVISQNNRGKFDTKIKHSSYIGSPHFLNNKIRYIFEENLEKMYKELLEENDFTKFEGLLSSPQLG